MALDVDGVVNRCIDEEKTLGRAGGFEPLHVSLSSPDRKVRILGSIVFSPQNHGD